MAKKTHARDDDDEDNDAKVEAREAVEQDKVEVVDKAERPAIKEQEPGKAYEGRATLELLETTDVEDIQALSDAIVALIQDAAYDDMTWPEIDRALRLTSHTIRQNWSATGTVKPAPPPEPPEDGELTRLEDETDEDFAARKRAARARHASGLKSDPPETTRAKYQG